MQRITDQAHSHPTVNTDTFIYYKGILYIVFNVWYLYFTIYLTFLFECSPALAMSKPSRPTNVSLHFWRLFWLISDDTKPNHLLYRCHVCDWDKFQIINMYILCWNYTHWGQRYTHNTQVSSLHTDNILTLHANTTCKTCKLLGHSRESRGGEGHSGQNCETLLDNSYNWHFSGPIGISAPASESWSTQRPLSWPLDETVAWLPCKSDGRFWKLSQAFWSKKNSYLFD